MTDTPPTDGAKLIVPYLKFRTKPYDIPPDLAGEMAAVLIEWGAFENAIILDLEQLRQFPQVSKLALEIPNGFSRKIQLWKRSINALFSKVPLYKNQAREICSKGKIVARRRNRIIHGLWRPHKDQTGTFQVLSGFDKRQQFGYFIVDFKFAADLHRDIRTMTEATYSFLTSRMLHAAQGLLVGHVEPKPGSPARRKPQKRERRRPQPRPSRE